MQLLHLHVLGQALQDCFTCTSEHRQFPVQFLSRTNENDILIQTKPELGTTADTEGIACKIAAHS